MTSHPPKRYFFFLVMLPHDASDNISTAINAAAATRFFLLFIWLLLFDYVVK